MSTERQSPSAFRDSEDARTLWRLADKARLEAAEHRNRALELDKEAARLDSMAAAIADGRSMAEAMQL